MGETLLKCIALDWVVIWVFAWATRKSQPCGGLEEQIPDRGNNEDQSLIEEWACMVFMFEKQRKGQEWPEHSKEGVVCLSVGRGPDVQGLPEFIERGFMRARTILTDILIKVMVIKRAFVKWVQLMGERERKALIDTGMLLSTAQRPVRSVCLCCFRISTYCL